MLADVAKCSPIQTSVKCKEFFYFFILLQFFSKRFLLSSKSLRNVLFRYFKGRMQNRRLTLIQGY